MSKKVFFIFLMFLFAAFSGILLSLIGGLPYTPEMIEYQKEFNSIGHDGVSPKRFEELKESAESSNRSMMESRFASKNFVVDYIVIPSLTLSFAYIWYRVGRYMGFYTARTVSLVLLLCLITLFSFGYYYQPFVHSIALLIGVFWVHLKNRLPIR